MSAACAVTDRLSGVCCEDHLLLPLVRLVLRWTAVSDGRRRAS